MTPGPRFSPTLRTARGIAALALLLASLLLGGCATGPQANPRDPLEPYNRGMTQFNEALDSAFLKPVATAYKRITPAPVRTGVSNFFANLGDLWSSFNNLLQLKIPQAAETFLRFQVNTFFGLAGILDIAGEAGIERHREDFGQTLGRWGVPAGPYVVLPFFGPSTLRDALAMPIEIRGNPISHIDGAAERHSLYLLRAVEVRANLLRASTVLDEAALDKYAFTRDAFLQLRRAEVFDGRDGKSGDDGSDGAIPPLDEPAPPAAPAAPASAPAR